MNGPVFCAIGKKHGNRAGRFHGRLCRLLLSLALASVPGPAWAGDGRRAYTGDSDPWLQAVGRLRVPGQRLHDGYRSHYLEDCSATLVALPGRSHADTVVTAWHCLELYGDLSRDIVFTARTRSGEWLEWSARRLADGGGMAADWAILRLDRAVPRGQLAALQPHPAVADPGRPVTMAGYSRDPGLGGGGRVLTYHPDCAITDSEPGLWETDCTAFKGASGGPVIQFSAGGEPLVCGVISQGNGSGTSTYVPLETFRASLNRYLR